MATSKANTFSILFDDLRCDASSLSLEDQAETNGFLDLGGVYPNRTGHIAIDRPNAWRGSRSGGRGIEGVRLAIDRVASPGGVGDPSSSELGECERVGGIGGSYGLPDHGVIGCAWHGSPARE